MSYFWCDIQFEEHNRRGNIRVASPQAIVTPVKIGHASRLWRRHGGPRPIAMITTFTLWPYDMINGPFRPIIINAANSAGPI
jgi:hypothetical protein